MHKKPLVSIIIPFHNRKDWVTESINSVINQTYSNWEIILVDDGSNDKNKIPSEILNNSKITLIIQENKGPSSARNIGIKNAKGKYIAFLDSDDIFLPKKLEDQIQFMENNPEISLSYTSYQYMDENKNFLEINNLASRNAYYPEVIFQCLIATPTVMVKKEILKDDLMFNETIKIGEDVILWSNILKKYAGKGIDKPLTYVRKHSMSTAFNTESTFVGQNNVLDYFLNREKENAYIKSRLLSGKAWNMYSKKLYKDSFFFSIYAVAHDLSNIKGWSCLTMPMKRKLKNVLIELNFIKTKNK